MTVYAAAFYFALGFLTCAGLFAWAAKRIIRHPAT